MTTVVLLLLALHFALQPQRVAVLLLDRAGKALGLELAASGAAELRLRGNPTIVLRDLVAREPGATTPLLQAARLSIAVPWSTIRNRGSNLEAIRIELDAPRLDLPALQHWLATRPPSKQRLPTLREGLRIRNGRIANDDWAIDGIQVEMAELAPGKPMRARLRGRYRDPPLSIPVDLAVVLSRPDTLVDGSSSGFSAAGSIVVERGGDWHLPATVVLSGPLAFGDDVLKITPARLGAVARYQSGSSQVPFTLGLHGPLRFDEAVWTLAPVALLLHGRDDAGDSPVPRLRARGELALGHRLALRLDGTLATWPSTWPALPQPLAGIDAPLPFSLRYLGAPDLSQAADLHLEHGDARFDARLRAMQFGGWIANDAADRSPLPPLDGRLVAPELEISGAKLHGVEITIDDAGVGDAVGNQDAGH